MADRDTPRGRKSATDKGRPRSRTPPIRGGSKRELIKILVAIGALNKRGLRLAEVMLGDNFFDPPEKVGQPSILNTSPAKKPKKIDP